MDSKEDPLVKISVEDDEPDTKETIKNTQENQQQNTHTDSDNIYQGRMTRSKTNSLPQNTPRFQASAANGNNGNNYSHQYPWAHDYLINSLKQVRIIN